MQKHFCRTTTEKFLSWLHGEIHVYKTLSIPKIAHSVRTPMNMLTKFFKYAGEIYDLLFINILVENDGEMSSSDTIIVFMNLCE